MDNELQEKIAGRRVVASISGGKDSAAMSLWLKEQGIEHERVFMDTGWEHPATYEYLRGELTRALGPIVEIRGALDFAGLIRKKGMFPSRTRRFCTEHLKVKPMIAHIAAAQDEGQELINAVGIRAAESEARSSLCEWEWNGDFDCDVWRPLIRWSERDAIDIHARHNLRPNPLYLLGASRVGCWPCIFARKSEILFLAENDPQRVELIRQLEAEAGDAAEARQRAKGTTLAEQGYQRPCFFQASGALRSEGTARGQADGRCVPIDDVIAWARTSRGGRQFEMFAAAGREAGCVRWGLCDTGGGA